MIKKIVLLTAFFSVFFSLPTSAGETNTYSVGIEGFNDLYREPQLNLTDRTNYGSVTASYIHQNPNSRMFGAIDLRGSHGKDRYQSPSGTLNGVPQWEAELRGRLGLTIPLWGGQFSPYAGLGLRYFLDEGKGYLSSTGAQAYDRRIQQFYVPIGASLSYATADGWSVTPQAEIDLLAYGNVDTRLTNLTGVTFSEPANNTQHLGIGGRSELMLGKTFGGYTLQGGPFIRYWYIGESRKVSYTNSSNGSQHISVYEPENNRTQIGVALRMLW